MEDTGHHHHHHHNNNNNTSSNNNNSSNNNSIVDSNATPPFGLPKEHNEPSAVPRREFWHVPHPKVRRHLFWAAFGSSSIKV